MQTSIWKVLEFWSNDIMNQIDSSSEIWMHVHALLPNQTDVGQLSDNRTFLWNVSNAEGPPSSRPNRTELQGAFQNNSSSLVITFLYFIVCVVGFCGNALVIYVILRYAKMKTVTNIYILNLAVADVLFMLSLPFFATQLALARWPFGAMLCRLVFTLDSLNQFTSIFCLAVMSMDRYLAVVRPLHAARWRKPTVARRVSVCVWAASLIVNVPVMVFSDLTQSGDSHTCSMVWPEPQDTFFTVFILYTFLLGFCLPLGIICLCYMLIVIKVKSSGMRVGSRRRRRSERKVTRMVSVVVAVFVLCWLPFYAFNVTSVTTDMIRSTPETKSTFELVVALAYANSCANPILYAFLSDNFYKSFRNVLCLRQTSGDAGCGALDDAEPSDSHHNRSRAANHVMMETQSMINGDVQTSI